MSESILETLRHLVQRAERLEKDAAEIRQALEDLEDVEEIRHLRESAGDVISWEQAKAELKAKS